MNQTTRILLAEGIGTAVLVIGGPGTAIFATGTFNQGLSVGILGVALAFGLSLMTMAYLIGRISGCHINPAVTIGMVITKKLEPAKAAPYIIAQVVGGIVGAGLLALIAERHGRLPRSGAERRLRVERLRRALAGRIRPAVGGDHRDRRDARSSC